MAKYECDPNRDQLRSNQLTPIFEITDWGGGFLTARTYLDQIALDWSPKELARGLDAVFEI